MIHRIYIALAPMSTNDIGRPETPISNISTANKTKGRPLKADSWAREKSNSCGALTKFLCPKRKRELEVPCYKSISHTASLLDVSLADPCSAASTSPPSKRVNSSVSPNVDNSLLHLEEDMETQLQEMQNALMLKLDNINADLRRQLGDFKREISSDLASIKEDISTLKSEALAAEARVDKKLAAHDASLTFLSNAFDQHDRLMRKGNVIIKGLNSTSPQGNLLQEVNNFFSEKFNLPNAVFEVVPLGPANSWILVKFANLEIKQKVMSSKAEILRGTNISISQDLTVKDRTIMDKARARVNAERALGRNAKLGHLRICIEGVWSRWSASANNFIPQPVNASARSKNGQH